MNTLLLDSMLTNDKPDDLGLDQVDVVYNKLWEDTDEHGVPKAHVLEEVCSRNPLSPKVLNIEKWPGYWKKDNPRELQRGRDLLTRVLHRAHMVVPGVRLGIYGMLADYGSELLDWRIADVQAYIQSLETSSNAIAGELDLRGPIDRADFLVQSCYVRWEPDSPKEAARRVEVILEFLRRNYNKEVFAFVWPMVHGNKRLVPEDTWDAILHECNRLADAVVLWSGPEPSWDKIKPHIDRAKEIIG